MPQLIERDAIAKRQDLSDVIHVADMKKTPFFNAVKKGTKPTNTLVEWPVDAYPTPTTAGAVDEADVQSFEDMSSPAAVLQGRIQIWERKPKVSRLAVIASNQAGVGVRQAYAKSLAKALIAIVRDIELTALGDNDSFLGTASKGFQTRGVGKWISSSAQTDLPVPEAYRPKAAAIYTGAIADLADDSLIAVLQAIYDETGDADMQLMGFAGSVAKSRVSKLTAYAKTEANYTAIRRYNSPNADTINQKVDVLDTDFGQVVLRLSSFINTGGDHTTTASKRRAHFLNMDTISMRFAEAPNATELANGGGGRRALVQAIGCLEVGNPLHLGGLQPAS
jgi:hypothetical protein